ncbi:MAG: ribosomal L7Ae/L30e/S12e/Gadd45 family protein [Eubacteriales bacterium]|nr:ribosomal L7Ae/L30e/S12e/Gadd45 family protein [Eubacteriales bacterium]
MDETTVPHRKRIVGTKQVTRALEAGAVETVWLAEDADERIRSVIEYLCHRQGIVPVAVKTMKELGENCRITVGAAVAAELKDNEFR